MATTEPIRTKEELEELKEFFEKEKPNVRNYALISLGVNSILA